MRRRANGMPGVLFVALLVFARLAAASIPMPLPSTDPGELLALQTICHTGGHGQPADPTRSDHTDCLLCPVCQLVSQVALPTPTVPVVPPPPLATIGFSPLLPPATGPPSRPRATAQPTGPPTPSA